MRRRHVVAGALVAIAGLLVPANVVAAGDTRKFCSPMSKAFNAIDDLDITDLDAVSDGFAKAAKQFRKAAKSAPSDLRKSIKKVAKVFDEAAKLDAGDIGDLVGLAVEAQVDFETIRARIKTDCGLDIPAVPVFG